MSAVQVTTQQNDPLGPFGSTLGGDTVLLTGSGFAAGLTVLFGPNAAVVVNVNPAQVEVRTPAGGGTVDISITNIGGATVTLTAAFRYIQPPQATTLKVTTGPTAEEDRAPIAGGETLEVTGLNFENGTTISIAGLVQATTFLSTSRLTCLVPPVLNEQSVDVVVTNLNGMTSTLVRGLAYTQEFSLERETRPLTQGRANHLFRRAAFGASPARITQATADGLQSTVTQLMTYTNDTAVEDDAFTIYGVTWIPPAANIANRTNQQWWLHQMNENPNPFQERMAWMLHDHFATSGREFNTDFTWTLYEQIKTFRRFSMAAADALRTGENGLDYNWGTLCVEMGKDRAMLDWLDGRVSRVGNPNENYARELWELFMLGEGNGYTEADIQEAARAFTGFVWFRVPGPDPAENRRLDITYLPGFHDTGDKTILGATGKFGYDSVSPFHPNGAGVETDPPDTDGGVVALTLAQRPVESSEFICGKLATFFLYDDPHEVVVQELAADLRAPGPDQWNLKPIIEKILLSKAMYSSRAMKGKVKSPVDFLLGFLRTTEIDLNPNFATASRRMYDRLLLMGQVPIDPPDVNGWPSGTAWMASQAMIERYNFLTFAVSQLVDVPTQIDPLLPPVGQRTPTQLVDHIAGILDVQLSGNMRTRAIEYVTTEQVGDVTQPLAFDPNNDTHLRMKTRGLLFMIGQYHDAHQD